MAALWRSCVLLGSKMKFLAFQKRFGSYLYHPLMLGIPAHLKKRMELNDEIGDYKEKFLDRVRQTAANKKSKVYQADLVSLIGIAQTDEEVDLVIKLLKRYQETLFRQHVSRVNFGIDVLRLLHIEDKIEEAYSLFYDRDQFISPLYRSWGCVNLMTDMLYKGEMYTEMIDLYHLSKEFLWGDPQNLITAALAALYKMNTEDALRQALYILNEIEQKELGLSKRSFGFLIMLVLNLQKPEKALELMSSSPCQGVMKGMNAQRTRLANFKLLPLIQLERIDEVMKILEGFLRDPHLEGELPLFSETIDNLEAVISKRDDKYKLKFATFKRALYRGGLAYPQKFNDYVSMPIYSKNFTTSYLKTEYARKLAYES